jgi:signal transduction histidine kinase
MRRLSLSSKLFVAALPLVIALGALVALDVRHGMKAADQARRGAELGSIWEPLIASIRAIEYEQSVSAGNDPIAIRDARRATSAAMAAMNSVAQQLDDSTPLTVQLGKVLASIGTARNATDNPDIGYTYAATADDFFDEAESDLVALGHLLPVEAGDRNLGRQLTAVAALAQVEQTGSRLVQLAGSRLNANPTPIELEQARTTSNALADAIGTFQATAPATWMDDFRASDLQRHVNNSRRTIEQVITFDRDAGAAPSRLDLRPLIATMAGVAEFRDARAADIVIESDAAAEALRTETLMRALVTGLAVAMAGLLALIVTRSITRRVRTVSKRAHEVSTTQLPALVEALRDPRSGGSLPAVEPIDARGTDELAELAGSFNTVQATLVEVANEQLEVLQRGVSDIFVTMARRNRSLVDRQLALLDELESDEHDHETLANYFQLDHLATRMRRNSESLLVLANAEPRRRRAATAEIDDVVRAAIGEVEDYQRIAVMHLERLQVHGSAVAELSHLIAELLDNATAFSPPGSRVKVTGRFAGDDYLVRIIDEGVGMVHDRLNELNELLRTPPIIGLSVEPTLGMSVVSVLAAKHEVQVTLADGAPGLVVDIMLPSTIIASIDNGPDPAPGPQTGLRLELADTIPFTPEPAGPAGPAGAGSEAASIDELGFDVATFDLEAAWNRHDHDQRHRTGPACAEPHLPPPTIRPVTAEFSRPPAPPAFSPDREHGPVANPDATPLPHRTPEPNRSANPLEALPTRKKPATSADGIGSVGSVDGIGTTRRGEPPRVSPTSPSSTRQSTLSGVEAGRSPMQAPSLPARTPGSTTVGAHDSLGFRAEPSTDAAPPSITASSVDPETIRSRLRSFQTEHRTGRTEPADPTTAPHPEPGPDRGGDR